MTTQFAFTPLIIVGAGRSGTNILRDTLCRLDGFATWDCDEINPIWRHGNLASPHDEFTRAHARPDVRRFIRRAFEQFWRKTDRPGFVVEKTCASSLRVPFIDAVLPEAKFLFIVRDGVDVVASAGKRWRGELELESLPYYWAKIRNTPPSDLPVYGWSFLRARLGMATGRREHMAFWGPRAKALAELPAEASLEERCAIQWSACVEQSTAALGALAPERVFRLAYEDFTGAPVDTVGAILAFLGVERPNAAVESACAAVAPGSIGRGRRRAVGARAHEIMAPALIQLGYEHR